MESDIEKYWNMFIVSHPEYLDAGYSSWHFCDNKIDADNLAALVKRGIKRGTTSLLKSYELENEPLPAAGDISVITNWDSEPSCIIETIIVIFEEFKLVFSI